MTTETRKKRLIEVAFPLEEVSADSRKDAYRGSPHPQTLHRWWARRPLAACRAFIYASLIDDPEDDTERDELLKEVADLASWDAVRHPLRVVRAKSDGGSGLTGTELLKRARQRILDCNDGVPPKLLDPFAGGGAIPLEGIRLGCEVEASDLNPVAVLILKGTVEYPQKYGQPNSRPVPDYICEAAQHANQGSFNNGDWVEAYRRNPLAADVRYWGNWMLGHARDELAEFYPRDPDGSIPVAYLWSRTVPCPNCDAEMPLIRQYWLTRKSNRRVALEPLVDRAQGKVEFRIVEGNEISGDPGQATTRRGDTRCLSCEQVVKASQVHSLGLDGKLGAKLTVVVLQSDGTLGKTFRRPIHTDLGALVVAHRRCNRITSELTDDLPMIPDEPLAYHPQYMLVREYGLDQWGKLFTPRQLLFLTTCIKLSAQVYRQMLDFGQEPNYVAAVMTYIGLAISRLSSEHSTLARWNPSGQKVQGALGLQALPMVWDYAEANPWGGSVGDARTAFRLVSAVIEFTSGVSGSSAAKVIQRDARQSPSSRPTAVITDPPYYDSINYADISDFYYVWLKRSLGTVHPDLLNLPTTPKRQQVVMNVYGSQGNGEVSNSKELGRQRYIDGMAESFKAMAHSLKVGGCQGVVFAHTDPDAWATLIEGLIRAGLIPNASWPIDTEIRTKLSAAAQARLKTSVWMNCISPNPPKGWRYSSGMGDEWQRGAMVRTGLRVDGSGGGLSAVAWRPCAVCGRWQGEMAGRGRSKRHSRTGVARVCGAVG